LSEVEKNNTTLIALRQSVEAEKIGNKTGIYLQNPVLELGYLWGGPAVIGNKTNIIFKQSFDFPTTYRYKNQISNLKNEQTEQQYQAQLKALMLETRIICNDLVHVNALLFELSKRLTHADGIANSYKSKYDYGETNIIEYNKAQLNLLNISVELESKEVEKSALLAELTRLNGGVFIDFSESSFLIPEIPADFEQWYLIAEENSPLLSWLKQEVELSQKQEKLSRAMSLPKIQTGYMSEKVIGQQYQGITFGLSLPLWENKNTVKYARTNTLAMESIKTDNKLQLYNQLITLHNKAISLQKNANDYRVNLLSFDNSELLIKALDNGEISLIEYILELTIYYESFNKLIDLERDLSKTLIELNQYM
ncbi:MAG: TolC family protein, partial [Bacteroidales bacterium]|nr:TolC family protein [Bacteroidales bacterium]